MYCLPLPRRAPSPNENSGLRRFSTPPDGRQHQSGASQYDAGTRLLGECRRSLPVLAQPGEEAIAGRGGLVDDAVAGVAVVADRTGVDEDRHLGVGDGPGQHLGGADAAVAQALLERARPPLGAHVDAAQVHHGVDAAQRAGIALARVRVPEHVIGVCRWPPHQPQHPVVGARSADVRAEPISPEEPAIAMTALDTVTSDSYRPRSASNAPSSRRRLMVVRKRPASAPSMSRWSYVSGR